MPQESLVCYYSCTSTSQRVYFIHFLLFSFHWQLLICPRLLCQFQHSYIQLRLAGCSKFILCAIALQIKVPDLVWLVQLKMPVCHISHVSQLLAPYLPMILTLYTIQGMPAMDAVTPCSSHTPHSLENHSITASPCTTTCSMHSIQGMPISYACIVLLVHHAHQKGIASWLHPPSLLPIDPTLKVS